MQRPKPSASVLYQGFNVDDLVELYAPDDAQPHEYYSFVTPDWARKWPAEEIWAARKLR